MRLLKKSNSLTLTHAVLIRFCECKTNQWGEGSQIQTKTEILRFTQNDKLMNKFLQHLGVELEKHLPYTVFSVSLGMVILGVLTYIAEILGTKDFSLACKDLFHVFHPLHMLFSATATTAMFWRHERNFIKAVVIGFIGAVGICGASDIIIPYISGFLLGTKMQLHICIFQHPSLILPFVIFGIFTGLIVPTTIESTIFTHTAHVILSSGASILYLVSFGLINWINVAGMVFIYMVLAVMIPCCTSDIIFPLLFVHPEEHKD